MERIRGSSLYRNVYQMPAQLQKTAGSSAEHNNLQGTENSKNQDVLEFSTDWMKQAEDFLEQMEREYPGISIVFRESVNGSSIPWLAAGLGAGTHLVVTRDFLERMGSSKEEFMKCKTAVTDILAQLKGEAGKVLANGAVLGRDSVRSWSVPVPAGQEPTFPLPPSNQNNDLGLPKPNDWKKKFAVKYSNYGAAASYSRLAGASTKGQVRTVMGEAHRSMASLRMVIAFGDDKDAMKAKAAIGSLQKLLVRGKRKMRRLDEETLLKIRKNRAQKQNELKKYRQMKLELEKKRSHRRSADSALQAEGMLEDANRKLRFHEDRDREYEAAVPAVPDMALPSAGVMPVPGGAAFSAEAVVVSAEVAI